MHLLTSFHAGVKEHVTGKLHVVAKSIKVQFLDMGDEHGAITAHTCSYELIFPRGFVEDTEQSYEFFSVALRAICKDLTFNIV